MATKTCSAPLGRTIPSTLGTGATDRLPVGYSSKGTYWVLHSKTFPFSNMGKGTKRAKRSLYGIQPQAIASRKYRKALHPSAQVELLNVREKVRNLRDLTILASRRVEQGLPIRTILKGLYAEIQYNRMQLGKRTMSSYLSARYAKHCVSVLLQAQSVWVRWIPPETGGLAPTSKRSEKGIQQHRFK